MYKDTKKAGCLAVALAREVFYGDKVLSRSGLSSDHGRLGELDPKIMSEIEAIIQQYYKGRVRNTDELWEAARKAIAKKCQALRGHGK